MAKIAISTASYFGTAIIDLLHDAGYDTYPAGGDCSFVLVNTTKLTAKDGSTAGDRQVFCPTTQWGAIAALVNAADGGAQAAAPVSTSFRVGDRVTAVNTDKTKANFRLEEGFRYVVAGITPSGKLNLGGDDDYLPSRFTLVASAVAAPVAAPVALPAPAAIIPADFACNPLAVGDTVLVVLPTNSKPQFVLRTDGVAVITRITAKGALGFAFDADNEFLSKRFQKVMLQDCFAPAGYQGIQSGDLVVARPGKHSRSAENAAKFNLPTDTALVFRGVTVDKGNFILDGYAEHQYSPKRFSVVTPVLAN